MSTAVNLVPTVTEYSRKETVKWVNKFKEHTKAIHFDVIDESYGPQTWIDEYELFDVLKDFENVIVHLMVSDPIAFLTNKTDVLRKQNVRYLIHYKKIDNKETLTKLKDLGYQLGVFFELGDVLQINNEYLEYIDEIMFMPIKAGKTGQKADLSILQDAHTLIDEHLELVTTKVISFDGGFSEGIADKLGILPLNIIYANSFFKNQEIEKAFINFAELMR